MMVVVVLNQPGSSQVAQGKPYTPSSALESQQVS